CGLRGISRAAVRANPVAKRVLLTLEASVGRLFGGKLRLDRHPALDSGRRREVERGGVDAVARALGSGPVVEDVAEMRVAAFAPHLDAMHAVAVVVEQPDVFLLLGMRKARPSAVRLELGVGREERLTARPAEIRAVVVDRKQLPAKRRLGAGLAQHVVALGPELLPPLLLALLHFRRDVVFHHRLLALLITRGGAKAMRGAIDRMKLFLEI